MKVLGVRLKYFMPGMMALYFVCDSLGVFVHLWELDYYFEFSYPLEGDLQVRTAKEETKIVQSTNLCFCNICVYPMHFYIFLQSLMSSKKWGEIPAVAPINPTVPHLLLTATGKCAEMDDEHFSQLGLVILVKSGLGNFEHRNTIRDTWGLEDRFPNIPIRTVFLVGTSESRELVGTFAEKLSSYEAWFLYWFLQQLLQDVCSVGLAYKFCNL